MYQLVTLTNTSADVIYNDDIGFTVYPGASIRMPIRFFKEHRDYLGDFTNNYTDVAKGSYDGLRFATKNNQVAIDGLCEYAYEMGGGEIYLPAAEYGGVW